MGPKRLRAMGWETRNNLSNRTAQSSSSSDRFANNRWKEGTSETGYSIQSGFVTIEIYEPGNVKRNWKRGYIHKKPTTELVPHSQSSLAFLTQVLGILWCIKVFIFECQAWIRMVNIKHKYKLLINSRCVIFKFCKNLGLSLSEHCECGTRAQRCPVGPLKKPGRGYVGAQWAQRDELVQNNKWDIILLHF
jgi:hypothetical protein